MLKFLSFTTKSLIKWIEYQLMFLVWFYYYYYAIVFDIKILKAFIFILLVVLASTYLSLLERHIVAVVQQRVGPTVTALGLLQPLADAFKLLTKEPTRPYRSNLFFFRLAPIYTFVVAITIWTVLPLSKIFIYSNIKYSILFILALLSISNYGIILGSWASHNKFAVFSAVRTLALTNSYGISISLIFLYPCALSNSYNIFDIISAQKYTLWFIVPGLPLAILYWIIVLTEIKKIPFDVTESEAELGSGYLIEYSGMGFALFIISEYCYILIVSILFVCCFLGGYTAPFNLPLFFINWFILKTILSLIFYFLIRSSLPNFRFDYIMTIHWKFLFPLLLVFITFLVLLSVT